MVEDPWWKFDDTSVKAVRSHAAFEDNFPISKCLHPGIQTASLLLYETFSPQAPHSDREEENRN
jgi:hypothetical protein